MDSLPLHINLAYGFIDDVKIKPGNWSVKVIAYPQPPIYAVVDKPYRYGGQLDPTDDNKDGWGEWVTLGEPPHVIAHSHGVDQLKGLFVEIRFRGEHPWYGQAFIVNQANAEDVDILNAEERGAMRILSANAPLI